MPLRKSRARRNRKSPLLRRVRVLRAARRKISSVPSSPPAADAEAGPLDHALSKSATSKTVEMMPRTIARSGGMKGRRSFIWMSSLVVEGRAQLLRNDLRRGTGRQQEEEMAVAVDDVDEARMRDGVVIAVLGLDLLVDDFERFCGGRDSALRSCQADEAGMYRSKPF